MALRAPAGRDTRPVLLFFSTRRSGPARRMSSLVAWVGVTEKKRLRVVEIDADVNAKLAHALKVSDIPTLVLLSERKVVGRHAGRATGTDIDRLIQPYLK